MRKKTKRVNRKPKTDATAESSDNSSKGLLLSPWRFLLHAFLISFAALTLVLGARLAIGMPIPVQSLIWLFSMVAALTLLNWAVLVLIINLVSESSRVVGFIFSVITSIIVSLGVILASIYLAFGLHPGDLINMQTHWDFVFFTLLLSVMCSMLAVYHHDVSQRIAEERSHTAAERLQSLHSRIRPHFLFNSMNSVATLITKDPERAEGLLEDLADVFRVVLADARKLVPLNAEIELADRYLNIERTRLGNRLEIEWNVEDFARSALIPSLTLQPLLENAVYHGIEPRFVGGAIDIEIWTDKNHLLINISNPIPEIQTSRREGNRIAQANVRERLARYFGPNAELRSAQTKDQYIVRVRIPIIYQSP